MKVLGEFDSLAGFFFARPSEFERPLNLKVLKLLKELIEKTENKHDTLEAAVRTLAEEHGLKAKDVFMDLRIAVTGKTVGPPLLESLEILGKEETLSRLA